MKKTLVAQSIAALIGGLGVIGAVQAAVVGPTDGRVVNGVSPGSYYVVNTDGIGHANIVPYFTAAGNNDTYINITNTDVRNAKALKVRFRGASNSDDVFDFTLLMSPGDNFAAAITKDPATGLPKLITNDKSCTLPNGISGRSFVTTRLNPALDAAGKAQEASEGYVEIFNMADIPPTPAPTGTNPPDLYNSIKHVAGVPRDCNSAAVNALFNDSTSYDNRNVGGVETPAVGPADANPFWAASARGKGLDVPTTGVMTNWTIINVPTAASWTGGAVALQAQTNICQFCEPGYGNVVLFPQAATAVDADGVYTNARRWTADPLLRGGLTENREANAAFTGVLGNAVIKAASYDFPDMSTPYLPQYLGQLADGNATKRQAYVLSRALSHNALTNEYVTDVGVLAKTDWIFSMPTRRYNVARDYAFDDGTGRNLFTDWANLDGGAVDVNGVFGVGDGYQAPANMFTPGNTSTAAGQICVKNIATAGGAIGSSSNAFGNLSSPQTADREERFLTSPTEFVVSPGEPAAPLTFCGEVSVLSFNVGSADSLLGAKVARKDLTVPYVDGWVRISTPGETNAIGRNLGLPSVGFSAMRFTNGAVSAGTNGNFGLTFPHRASRTLVTDPGLPAP